MKKDKKRDDRRLFDCPTCGLTATIDQDQYEGKASIQCPACDFHETINLKELED
ncbi:hypothetical protein LCGC14_1418610 [marine sediment metagenome]|uniref:Uncharacterized protein n=1 Tax=marine sediment metagenome TaxID=412755 RepID=A0A0F9KDB0_9ZZZZ